jgi:hypothetical protein
MIGESSDVGGQKVEAHCSSKDGDINCKVNALRDLAVAGPVKRRDQQ